MNPNPFVKELFYYEQANTIQWLMAWIKIKPHLLDLVLEAFLLKKVVYKSILCWQLHIFFLALKPSLTKMTKKSASFNIRLEGRENGNLLQLSLPYHLSIV